MSPHEMPAPRREHNWNVADYSDTPYYPFLKRFPIELAKKHLQRIGDEEMSDEEATEYLKTLLTERKEATTTTVVGDPKMREMIAGREADTFRHIETDLYTDPAYLIDAGQTARIKKFEMAGEDEAVTVAVKYLITPTAKTLSAAAEYDMVHEVGRMWEVEKRESNSNLQHIKVPHTYFHHKTEKLQCYGMEHIPGTNLERINEEEINDELRAQLTESLSNISKEEIEAEIEIFCKNMHTYCLHGDIKPANVMLHTDGSFYLIDFGQSVLLSHVPENTEDQTENLKTDEVDQMKYVVNKAIRKILQKSAT